MLRQFSTRRIVISACFDFLCTLGLLLASAYGRSVIGALPEWLIGMIRWLNIPIQNWEVYSPSYTLNPAVFVLVAIIWPFFFVVFYVYDGRYNSHLGAELRNVLLAIIASTLTLAGILYFTYQETSRVLFLLFFILDVIFLLGIRAIWSIVRSRFALQSKERHHHILIIGAGAVGRDAALNLKKYAGDRQVVIGFVDDDVSKMGQQIAGVPVLGTLDQIEALSQTYRVNKAIVALPLRAHERLVGICRKLQSLSIHVHVIPDLFALSFPGASLDGFGGIPVIDLGQPGLFGLQRWGKRFFDVVTTSVILFFLWPVIALISLIIIFDSGMPVFYRQKRIGENGIAFDMIKFRSMRVDADEAIHREHIAKLIADNTSIDDEDSSRKSLKLQNDPRITRVGHLLRKTSLDEIPQLFNVLKGEMSLVGPRPPIPYEVDMYQEWHKRRLEAIPGMTGLWQVEGRNRVSFDEMVRMDLEYIKHQSIWLDLKLLIQTPFALLRGAG